MKKAIFVTIGIIIVIILANLIYKWATGQLINKWL